MNELAAREYPILEYDPGPGVIEPAQIHTGKHWPDRLVMCYFAEQIKALVKSGQALRLDTFGSEAGPNPVYQLAGEPPLALMHPGVGAPYAAAMLDEAIACGARRVIVCGSGGVLDREITVGHLLVLEDAVRDEGTSYHYLPPARKVAAHPLAVQVLRSVLSEHGVAHLGVTTWTTDAFYRETPARVRLRRQEGCLCVEMEAAAFFAVAQYRHIILGQLLYAGDDVSGLEWDPRGWIDRRDARALVLQLAIEAARRL